MRNENPKKGLIITLVLVIVVLAGLVIYLLAVRPAISGYVIDAQNEGFQYAIFSIMQQAATCDTVPLTFGNQTINLVAVECFQEPPIQE